MNAIHPLGEFVPILSRIYCLKDIGEEEHIDLSISHCPTARIGIFLIYIPIIVFFIFV